MPEPTPSRSWIWCSDSVPAPPAEWRHSCVPPIPIHPLRTPAWRTGSWPSIAAGPAPSSRASVRTRELSLPHPFRAEGSESAPVPDRFRDRLTAISGSNPPSILWILSVLINNPSRVADTRQDPGRIVPPADAPVKRRRLQAVLNQQEARAIRGPGPMSQGPDPQGEPEAHRVTDNARRVTHLFGCPTGP